MKRILQSCGVLAAALSVFPVSPVLAQSQSPPVTAPRQGQAILEVPTTPAIDLAALSLSVAQTETLAQALRGAGAHGLPPGAFAPDAATALLASQEPGLRAKGQAQLIDLTLAYARAVHVGRLPVSGFITEWGLRPDPYDPAPDFVAAVQQDRIAAWLSSLPPPYAGYQTLMTGLAAYRGLAAKGGWSVVPSGPSLIEGMSDPRVKALRGRLAVEDPTVVRTGGDIYDAALVQAVRRAQKRFGLEPDGVVGPGTLSALNVPIERRVDQIEANMERWRWLPQTLPADRIQVNVAAAVMSVFQQDTPTLTMRAVTGRPGDETPMLSSLIHSIVLNPPWNVPQSIATKELWPKERANPGYLARNDFIVIPTGDGGSRLQQKAGPKAALGQVKFDFDNPYGVYLHDTPSRSKFDSFSRLASHGCVRLQKPIELVKLLMAGDPVWTPEKIDQALASGDTVRAKLPEQVAVFLLYWTAYVTPDGQVNFRDDPYGWDKQLVQRIAAL